MTIETRIANGVCKNPDCRVYNKRMEIYITGDVLVNGVKINGAVVCPICKSFIGIQTSAIRKPPSHSRFRRRRDE